MNRRDIIKKMTESRLHPYTIANAYAKMLEHLRYPDTKPKDEFWKNEKPSKCYSFVPSLITADLIRTLKVALERAKLKNNNPSFIDAGCGPGTIIAAAAAVGFKKIYGVDIDPISLDMAEKMKRAHNLAMLTEDLCIELINADITKFDYSEYDVIYAFQPARHESEPMEKLLELFRNNTSSGTVLVLDINTDSFKSFRDDPNFEELICVRLGEGAIVKK